MNTEKLSSLIPNFDPELYDIFKAEFYKQKNRLSLVPEENYTSPLSAYLEGSILTNANMQIDNQMSALEQLTIERIKKVFGCEHATVRANNIATASRMVLYSLLKAGDKILSLDMRKKEHCNNDTLQFEFINFGINTETEQIDLEEVKKLAERHKPKMIIYSAANYPCLTGCAQFGKIAKSVGAYMWFDISQKAGMIAAGTIPSPVPYADVVTFSTHESLQGPQGSVILCKKELATSIDHIIALNGHSSLKMNVLAAMAIIFKECTMEKFKLYNQQVFLNAKELARGLRDEGVHLICGDTDNHLVLADTGKFGLSAKEAQTILEAVGIGVSTCKLSSSQSDIHFEGLRMSSLRMTTRGVKEKDMYVLGSLVAHVMKNRGQVTVLDEVRNHVTKITTQYPLFSEEWVEEEDITFPSIYETFNSAMYHVTAESKQYYLKELRDSVIKFIQRK